MESFLIFLSALFLFLSFYFRELDKEYRKKRLRQGEYGVTLISLIG